jgi:hypothetical protein
LQPTSGGGRAWPESAGGLRFAANVIFNNSKGPPQTCDWAKIYLAPLNFFRFTAAKPDHLLCIASTKPGIEFFDSL